MKRIALFILCFTLLLGAVACGQDKPAVTESGTEGATEGATETVTDTESRDEAGTDNPSEGEYLLFQNAFDKSSKTDYRLGNVTLSFDYGEMGGGDQLPEADLITVRSIDQTTGQVEESTISLPEKSEMFGCDWNSIDESTGFLFLYTAWGNNNVQLSYIAETKDGGHSWELLDMTPLRVGHKEQPIMSCFTDENTAIISYNAYLTESLSERTFVTFDKGKTWGPLTDLPYPQDFDESFAEIVRMEYFENTGYVITVKVCDVLNRYNIRYVRFSTDDFKTWDFLDFVNFEWGSETGTPDDAPLIPDCFRAVIDGEKDFFLNGKEVGIRIGEYRSPYLQRPLSQCETVRYAVHDMNGDGQAEVLIEGWCGDILVLHEENGVIYGDDFVFRAMYHVNTDGSFLWNANAGKTYGRSKLEISGGICRSVELYRVEVIDSRQTFFVEGKESTEQEYTAYMNQFSVDPLMWYPLDRLSEAK